METKPKPAENLDNPFQIRLCSGRYVDPLNLKVEDITLRDIAHGPSHRCRFNGHTVRFYSVAEHSLRVMQLVTAEFWLPALLHDASEAYLFDIPTPVKQRFPQLQWVENQVQLTIFKRFDLSQYWPLPDVIKRADRRALEEEWAGLMIGDNYLLGHTAPAQVAQRFYAEARALLTQQKGDVP